MSVGHRFSNISGSFWGIVSFCTKRYVCGSSFGCRSWGFFKGVSLGDWWPFEFEFGGVDPHVFPKNSPSKPPPSKPRVKGLVSWGLEVGWNLVVKWGTLNRCGWGKGWQELARSLAEIPSGPVLGWVFL